MLRDILAKRKAVRDNEARLRGYNYAAGQLLKSGENVTTMFFKLEAESYSVDGRTPFDSGISEALADYEVMFMRLLAT